MPPLPPLRLIPAIALCWALTGCAKPQEQTLRIEVIGAPESLFLAPPSPAALMLRAATTEGLITLDAEGRVIPALAERWIIADDGQSYIFRLRDDPQCSAESVSAALSKAIASQHGTPLGLDLAVLRDIRAMAARVVEIRLYHPMPDFLQVLAQPELGLLGKAGPLSLRREGDLGWLTPIRPDQRGQPMPDGWASSIRPLTLTARPVATAAADFAAGRTDMVLGGRFTDFPGTLRGLSPQFDPVSGLFGLMVEREDGLLATPESREAIAMTIDRAALAIPLHLPDWAPTTRLIPAAPESLPNNAERWADLDMAARRQLARERLAVLAPNHPATLRLALPTGPGADVLAQRLAMDFGQIGLRLERVPITATADLRLLDSVAWYPAPSWAFHQFACAVRHPCSPEADALATSAEQADPVHAPALYAAAEVALTRANLFIPLGPPLRWSLTHPNLTGFALNRWAHHPLPPLSAHTH